MWRVLRFQVWRFGLCRGLRTHSQRLVKFSSVPFVRPYTISSTIAVSWRPLVFEAEWSNFWRRCITAGTRWSRRCSQRPLPETCQSDSTFMLFYPGTFSDLIYSSSLHWLRKKWPKLRKDRFQKGFVQLLFVRLPKFVTKNRNIVLQRERLLKMRNIDEDLNAVIRPNLLPPLMSSSIVWSLPFSTAGFPKPELDMMIIFSSTRAQVTW